MTHPAHRQSAASLRFGWGLAGARAVAADVDVAVVVDVLSFTTTTTVALDADATVMPWRWRDASASEEAGRRHAVLAVGRSVAGPGQVSLSPAGMRRGARPGMRVLLPSPNGATIAHELAAGSAGCVAASLRNASAVGRWLADAQVGSVAVVAAGEQWPDGSLRPAVEDLWGAGAVIDAVLRHTDRFATSPETRTARTAFRAVAASLSDELHACASGLELAEGRFGEDVAVAAELDSSEVVPVLADGCFVPAATLRS